MVSGNSMLTKNNLDQNGWNHFIFERSIVKKENRREKKGIEGEGDSTDVSSSSEERN